MIPCNQGLVVPRCLIGIALIIQNDQLNWTTKQPPRVVDRLRPELISLACSLSIARKIFRQGKRNPNCDWIRIGKGRTRTPAWCACTHSNKHKDKAYNRRTY